MASGSDHNVPLNYDEEKGLHRTTTSVVMSPELFEKLYLNSKAPHAGSNNRRFANPTPLSLVGFTISTFTFAMVLMGWNGASGASPVAGIFFFTGPLLLTLATIFEWIMGNFFAMMVAALFSVFWLSFGMIQLPTLQLGSSYATEADPTGTSSAEYNTALALYLIVWGFAMFHYFIFTLKVNAVFASIFGIVTPALWVLAAAYFKVAAGDYVTAQRLQTVGGAMLFVVAALGWYMSFVIMAAEMQLPVKLPVGDLSRFWPSANREVAVEEHTD